MADTVKTARHDDAMGDDANVHDPRSGRVMGVRELHAAHEIAQAFLATAQPIEVYRLALARVTPMVNADFAAVFMRDDGDHELLRPVCLHGWPQASARYLGQLRIRVGLGPTGGAVADNVPVEVADIFADERLTDWHQPARELGFASMITLPLATQTAVNGAVSFYFAEPHTFSDDERSLLRLISEQLAATTTRARVLDDLRIENERLRVDAEHLATAIREAEIDANQHDSLIAGVVNELTLGLDTGGNGTRAGNHHLAGVVDDLTELLDLRLGRATLDSSPGDALRLARQAAGLAGTPQPGAEFSINAGDAIIAVTTDGPRVTRTLSAMLREAFRRTARGSIVLTVRAVREESGQWVEWAVSTRGIGLNAGGTGARSGADRLTAALAFTTVEALGGLLLEDAEPGTGWSQRLRLPLRAGRPRG